MTVLSNHAAGPGSPSHCEEDLLSLLDKIHDEMGWDFRHYKKPSLRRRISTRLSSHNVSSFKDYRSVLESNPAEYGKLFSTLTIKVSEFLREPEVFELLRETVTSSFSIDDGIRAWSCGCAYGEEAYSIGITLAECVGAGDMGKVKIFATDIDGDAIDTARKGIYREEFLQNLSMEMRERYFIKTEGAYKIRYDIRDMVRFGILDIIKNDTLSRIDILFCRNLLIYFEKELQGRVLQKLDLALRPGGILVLGMAEVLPPSLSSRYREIKERSRVYRKII